MRKNKEYSYYKCDFVTKLKMKNMKLAVRQKKIKSIINTELYKKKYIIAI